MPLLLLDALRHTTLAAADPVVRAGTEAVKDKYVRWIHSSEVLDIAPLLRGGELLLTGGEALATAPEQRRIRYIEELADRGITAVAIETGGVLPGIPQSMVRTAEDRGLPLVELRKVVPFVGVLQAINSMLVSESVTQLQLADEASHSMSLELAHGGSLDGILEVLTEVIGGTATLASVAGSVLAQAGTRLQAGSPAQVAMPREAGDSAVVINVPVRGIVSARLELGIPDDGDSVLARIVGTRCADVLGLALLQRMPPSLGEVARTELLRAINAGGAPWRLEQLGPAAGFGITTPAVMIAARTESPQEVRIALDQLLRRQVRHSASYSHDSEVIAIASLESGSEAAGRSALIEELAGLGTAPAKLGQNTARGRRSGTVAPGLAELRVAVGPFVTELRRAPWSLVEARHTLDLARREHGPVVDAEAFAVERLATAALEAGVRGEFVRQQLGNVLDHDAQRTSQLLRTLTVWLDSGCNTAKAARELHLERQSMHHRLQRIFELCGGDPRTTGRLAALHLAARLARLQ